MPTANAEDPWGPKVPNDGVSPRPLRRHLAIRSSPRRSPSACAEKLPKTYPAYVMNGWLGLHSVGFANAIHAVGDGTCGADGCPDTMRPLCSRGKCVTPTCASDATQHCHEDTPAGLRARMLECVFFGQYLEACRRRTPRTAADPKTPKAASRRDLSNAPLRFDLALGARRRHAPKSCQQQIRPTRSHARARAHTHVRADPCS